MNDVKKKSRMWREKKKLNDRMTPKRTETMNQEMNIVSRIDNNKYSER